MVELKEKNSHKNGLILFLKQKFAYAFSTSASRNFNLNSNFIDTLGPIVSFSGSAIISTNRSIDILVFRSSGCGDLFFFNFFLFFRNSLSSLCSGLFFLNFSNSRLFSLSLEISLPGKEKLNLDFFLGLLFLSFFGFLEFFQFGLIFCRILLWVLFIMLSLILIRYTQ